MEGRNKGQQGLAVAMLKLWEKTEIVKIAVKKRVQNTNNEMMADQIWVRMFLICIFLGLAQTFVSAIDEHLATNEGSSHDEVVMCVQFCI